MTPTTAYHLVTHLGPRWAAFRVRYAWRRWSGALRRGSPVTNWSALPVYPVRPLEVGRIFAPTLGPDAADDGQAVTEADAICRGRFRWFSFHEVDAGLRPDWHANPLTGERAPAERHWSEVGDFAHGDIKAIWELSRFSWAFTLARAYRATGEARYAQRFWLLFGDWLAKNSPNAGPNWMCGQEATFRLIAATFAADALASAEEDPADEVRALARFVLATGRRIRANLDYALSQKNNHGISECVGLLTAASLLPSAPEAPSWRAIAGRELESQLAELVYPDGGFAQHSAVYHRVLLHDLSWAVAVLRAAGEAVPAWLTAATARATRFLAALLDPATGFVPLYGPNDGANVLPLTGAEFLDFRPALAVARAACGPAPSGATAPGGSNSGDAAPVPAQHFTDAGCLVWRSGASRLFLRCPTRFRHRPTQADMLHVDWAFGGVPVAQDAGTFSYHAAGPFAGGLAEAAVHNTVTMDGAEPLARVGRFMFLPWPDGRAGWEGDAFTATHDGWTRIGAAHVRRIRPAEPGGFVVEDRVRARGRHRVRLHWLLANLAAAFAPDERRLELHTTAGPVRLAWDVVGGTPLATLVKADPASSRGWSSPHYLHAAPAWSLAIEAEFQGEITFVTRLGPA